MFKKITILTLLALNFYSTYSMEIPPKDDNDSLSIPPLVLWDDENQQSQDQNEQAQVYDAANSTIQPQVSVHNPCSLLTLSSIAYAKMLKEAINNFQQNNPQKEIIINNEDWKENQCSFAYSWMKGLNANGFDLDTALAYALELGVEFKLINELISMGAQTPLAFLIAVENNFCIAAKILLDNNINPNLCSRKYVDGQRYGQLEQHEYMLYVALKNNNLKMVTLLLQFKADVNNGLIQKNSKGRIRHIISPLQVALQKDNGEAVKLLIENGANLNKFNEGSNIFIEEAIRTGDLNILKLLTAQEIIIYEEDSDGQKQDNKFFLNLAAHDLEVADILSYLLEEFLPPDIHSLVMAVELKRYDLIKKFIVENGVNPNDPQEFPLLEALKNSDCQAVELLIDCGASITNQVYKNLYKDRKDFILQAVIKHNFGPIEFLLNESDKKENFIYLTITDYLSASHQETICIKQSDCPQLTARLESQTVTQDAITLLSYILVMLNKRIDDKIKGMKEKRDVALLRSLATIKNEEKEKEREDEEEEEEIITEDAMLRNFQEEAIRNLEQLLSLLGIDDQKFTDMLNLSGEYAELVGTRMPLICNVSSNFKEYFLQKGANPNSCYFGRTVLMNEESSFGVELLLRYGADVMLQDYEGRTALMYIIKKFTQQLQPLNSNLPLLSLKHLYEEIEKLKEAKINELKKIIQLLLDKDIRLLDVQDDNGLKAVDYAKELNNESILKMFEDYAGKVNKG